MKRRSIDATYDSRDTGDRFHVTTRVGARTVAFQRRVPDPFVRVAVSVGVWDALRALLRFRPVEVTVVVSGDTDVVNDVLELDYSTLVPGSTRHTEWNQHVLDYPAMLARVSRPGKTTTPKENALKIVTISWDGPREVAFLVDGREVKRVTNEVHGPSGVDGAINAVRSVAVALGAEVLLDRRNR